VGSDGFRGIVTLKSPLRPKQWVAIAVQAPTGSVTSVLDTKSYPAFGSPFVPLSVTVEPETLTFTIRGDGCGNRSTGALFVEIWASFPGGVAPLRRFPGLEG
jgi:hypothetical protein